MESIKRAYYYFYYRIYKTFTKNYNPLLSVGFRTDIVVMAVKIWFLGVVDTYLCILFNQDATDISITSPKVIIALALVIGSTLYFLTFSNKWKPYFEEFEKLPKRKNFIGGIIVWSIVIFIFINVFISVELMKKLNG
jgi:hypothetical protein